MVTANKDSAYEIPEIEQHLVHVLLRVPGVDENTEKPLHKAFVQCFYPDQFSSMDKLNAFKQYKTKIIHDPRSKKEIAEDLNNDALGKVPLSRMNRAELVQRYKDVYGVDAVPEDLLTGDKVNENLRMEIAERLEFLAAEEASGKVVNDASTATDGEGNIVKDGSEKAADGVLDSKKKADDKAADEKKK